MGALQGAPLTPCIVGSFGFGAIAPLPFFALWLALGKPCGSLSDTLQFHKKAQLRSQQPAPHCGLFWRG